MRLMLPDCVPPSRMSAPVSAAARAMPRWKSCRRRAPTSGSNPSAPPSNRMRVRGWERPSARTTSCGSASLWALTHRARFPLGKSTSPPLSSVWDGCTPTLPEMSLNSSVVHGHPAPVPPGWFCVESSTVVGMHGERSRPIPRPPSPAGSPSMCRSRPGSTPSTSRSQAPALPPTTCRSRRACIAAGRSRSNPRCSRNSPISRGLTPRPTALRPVSPPAPSPPIPAGASARCGAPPPGHPRRR